MRWIVSLALLAPGACTAFTPTPATQTRDLELLGPFVRVLPPASVRVAPDGTVDLRELRERGGLRFVDGQEPRNHPALAAAWKAGRAPAYGLLGSNGEQRLRVLELRVAEPWTAPHAELRARALHPVPFTLSLLRESDSGSEVLAAAPSVIWGGTEGAEGPGVHYAEAVFALPENRIPGYTRLRLLVQEAGSGWTAADEIRIEPLPWTPPGTHDRAEDPTP